jgi:hypothetical protein
MLVLSGRLAYGGLLLLDELWATTYSIHLHSAIKRSCPPSPIAPPPLITHVTHLDCPSYVPEDFQSQTTQTISYFCDHWTNLFCSHPVPRLLQFLLPTLLRPHLRRQDGTTIRAILQEVMHERATDRENRTDDIQGRRARRLLHRA